MCYHYYFLLLPVFVGGLFLVSFNCYFWGFFRIRFFFFLSHLLKGITKKLHPCLLCYCCQSPPFPYFLDPESRYIHFNFVTMYHARFFFYPSPPSLPGSYFLHLCQSLCLFFSRTPHPSSLYLLMILEIASLVSMATVTVFRFLCIKAPLPSY